MCRVGARHCASQRIPDLREFVRVGNIWAQLAESRPARRLPCFSGIPTRANYRGSEIDAFGGVEERVGQILAGQGIARPLIISTGREYSSPAQIWPTLLQMKTQLPAIHVANFTRKQLAGHDSEKFSPA